MQKGEAVAASPLRRKARRLLGRGGSPTKGPSLTSPSPTRALTSPANLISPSSESSGVSSRKSSLDHMAALDDLSEVQRQLVDVNQRYEMVGERLADRQNELQSTLDQVKGYLEDLQNILTFLEETENNSQPIDQLPISEADVAAKLAEHKVFHEELLEKEPIVATLRSKAQQLIQDREHVPGMKDVKKQLRQLEKRWMGLKELSEERKRSLESLAEDLKDFRELHDTLQNWLGQKEKMVTILGPVATEPVMVNTQLQQVQLLQEEMMSQQPQYEQFIQSGLSIVDKCDPESDPAVRINGQVDNISKSWDKLQSKLGEREATLKDTLDLATKYSEVLQSLNEWLPDVQDKLDAMEPVSALAEDVIQQQKGQLQSLADEVTQHKPKVDEARQLCKELCDSTKEASTKADLKNKLGNVERPFNDLNKKIDEQRKSIDGAVAEGQKFSVSLQDMMNWMSTQNDTLDQAEPLSAKKENLVQQTRDHDALQKEIASKEPEFRLILEKGQKMVECASPMSDVSDLSDRLDHIKSDWNMLKGKLNERSSKLKEANKHSEKFEVDADMLAAWLGLTEEKLTETGPVKLKDDQVAKQLKDAQAIQAEILRKSRDHESVNSEGQALISCTDADHDAIESRLNDINSRWDVINDGVSDHVQQLEDTSVKLQEFSDTVDDLSAALKKHEDKVMAHDKLGSAGKDPKHLDKMKNLQDDLDSLEPQIRYVKDYADSLLMDAGSDTDTSDVTAKLDDITSQYQKLSEQVKDIVSGIEAGSEKVEELQAEVRNLANDLCELEEDLDMKTAPGRDLHTISDQLEDLDAFENKLDSHRRHVDELQDKLRDMSSSGFLSDSDPAANQVEALDKQHSRLADQARQRRGSLDATAQELRDLEDDLGAVSRRMDQLKIDLDEQRPVSGDVDTIKQMQDEFKLFKDELEPVQKEVDAVNKKGQALIQSATPGVDTSKLENQLEEFNNNWSDINNQIHDRDRKLDTALLQSGKFQDAIASLLDWLSETEDLVNNQRSPSADFKVVKAQMQEQKFLQRMLDDRRPSVDGVKALGAELSRIADGAERDQVEGQLNDLVKRWDKLISAADARKNALEEAMQVAKQFSEKIEPFAEWLEGGEKKAANQDAIGTNVDKIKQQVKDQETVIDDITAHKKDLDDVIVSGSELLKHCTGEDTINIQDKVDNVKERYNDIHAKASDRLNQLGEALPLAAEFYDTHEKLLQWLEQVEPELRGKEAIGPEAEKQVEELEAKIAEMQPLLDLINEQGPHLALLSPGEGASKIEELVGKDNKKYAAAADQVHKRAEKITLQRQKSMEVINDIDDLLEWFNDTEKQVSEAEPISCDPETLRVQLRDHKSLNDDIVSQKSKARDIVSAAKRLRRESSMEEDPVIRDKLEDLKQQADHCNKQSADRLSLLEQAVPLAAHFYETHADLEGWFDETEKEIDAQEAPGINTEAIKEQQDRAKLLKQNVADHKPLLDRLNKTGTALLKLVGDEDAQKIQDTMEKDNNRFDAIKNAIREHTNDLDEALQQTSEFSDKLEGMLETMTTTAEMVDSAEPISAHPDKLKDQIADNRAIIEDMEQRMAALQAVKAASDELLFQAGLDDDAAKELRDKVDSLMEMYDKIKEQTGDRNRALEQTLGVSEKFWEDISALSGTLQDLQETLEALDTPALEPNAIREQQEALEALREELETTVGDLDGVKDTGDELIGLIGEPDKPEVEKNVDDMESTWTTLNDQWASRHKQLDDALKKATSYQDQLMNILEWLQTMEEQMSALGPIAADTDAVKQQLNELKSFKEVVHPKHLDIQSLNQQAGDLTKDSPTEAATPIKEPIADINKRWDGLLSGISDRQSNLQSALLNLGQFQSAIDELLSWLDKTENTIDEAPTVLGDPKSIEIELAKLRILQNDVMAHDKSVDSVKEAGRQVITSEGGAEAKATRAKLDDLDKKWDTVLTKMRDRQINLEDALREAKSFHDELGDMLVRLTDIDGQLITSKPVGGLPETAREQLEKFMETYNELEKFEDRVAALLENGEALKAKSPDTAAAALKQNLHNLQARWDNIKSRASDRKTKLEEASNKADNFHADLQSFIGWLTNTEKTLNTLKPVSRVMQPLQQQIEDHQALQKDISGHREAMVELDKTGTHLKYFSQKQDVILIKNLLASVQHRWEKAVSRCAERTRQLDHGYKETKRFTDHWSDLLNWLSEHESVFEEDVTIKNDPDKIKQQIAAHKEFQRMLGAKQPALDSVVRMGRTLKDKCPKQEVPVIQDMLSELKAKWNSVCSRSVDRQRKLEEALLFSGQFKDALQALLDWLYKMEPLLAEDQPVHGDLDTVSSLIEEHKAFQQELGKRTSTVASVRKTARDVMNKSEEDHSHLESQLLDLTTKWDRICKLSVDKQERLQQALKDAEDFHKKTHSLLEWLADAERHLRYLGSLPDDEEGLLKQLEDHKAFIDDLAAQEAHLQECLHLGQEILKRCHPDAVTTVKHWLTILQARWEEVSAWAQQREQKLNNALADMRGQDALLNELMAWLLATKQTLVTQDQTLIPENIPIIEQLLHDHQTFQQEISSRQPEVESLTKSGKRRPSLEPSTIPTLRHARRGTGPGRRGQQKPDGKKTPEPEFKNPRVAGLFNNWREVWLMSMDRQRKLQDALDRLNEMERMKNFDFDDWRRRYMRWMNHNKSRVMDFFRKQDKDRDGKVTRPEFIDGVMASTRWAKWRNAEFPTTRMEMEAVADIFDRDGDGYIDYKEFVQALRPPTDTNDTKPDGAKIQDEVKRQVQKCTCTKQFRMHKIGEGKYRFGESQKLRLVRILRSTVMVRVGGGWVALDEFLVKNDPCRAKGRTNIELREQFILAEGVSQSMAHFVSKSPGGASNRSPSSSHSGGSSTMSWSSRSASSATGPITKIREKSIHQTPWRQATRSRISPDTEVRNIMSPSGGARPRTPLGRSPRPGVASPGSTTSRNSSRPSSRASSRSSRPPSVSSDVSEDGPEVYTTMKTETRTVAGRPITTVTYQTHQQQTRTVTIPTSAAAKTVTSRIPKPSPMKKEKTKSSSSAK